MQLHETRKRSRWLRFGALATAGLLVAAAGCGDDGGDDDAATDAGGNGDGETSEPEGDFGGRIVGIEPGSGIMETTRDDVMPAYGLDDWTLQDSSTPAMLSELESAIENEEWVVVTLWQPHWAYSAYDIKNLEDPEGALGEGEAIKALARDGFSDDNPEVAQWVENFELTSDQLNGLTDLVINEYGEGSEGEAIDEWLSDEENQALTEEWIDSEAPSDPGEVEIGWIPWDEDVAVTYLWQALLEEQGYDVTLTQLDVGPVYSGLAEGDLDLFLDGWLPNTHSTYMDEHGDSIEDLGVWNDSATLHLTVPSYVPVDSIAELSEYSG